jgi:hypothetical protein
MIEVEKPGQPLSASHGASAARRRDANDQFVIKSLMVSFVMVVIDILTDRASQVAFAQRDQSVQALELDGPDEALCIRVTVGARTGVWTTWTPAERRNASPGGSIFDRDRKSAQNKGGEHRRRRRLNAAWPAA